MPVASLANPSGAVWTHDLFGPDSNLYAPTLSQAHYAPNPSRHPFGSSTPSMTPGQQPQAPVPQAHQERLGIKGEDGKRALRAQQQAEEQAEQARQEQARLRQLEREQELEQLRLVRQAEEQQRRLLEAATRELALIENSGTVVEVKGLVEGTSAEDVKVRRSRAPRSSI